VEGSTTSVFEPHPILVGSHTAFVTVTWSLDDPELGDCYFSREPDSGIVLEVYGLVVSPVVIIIEEFGSPRSLAPCAVVVVSTGTSRRNLFVHLVICSDFSDSKPMASQLPFSVLLETDSCCFEWIEGVSSGDFVALVVDFQNIPAADSARLVGARLGRKWEATLFGAAGGRVPVSAVVVPAAHNTVTRVLAVVLDVL